MKIELEESYKIAATPDAEALIERLISKNRAATLPIGLRSAAEVRAALLALARKAKEDAVDADDIASAEAWIGRIEAAYDTELMLHYVGRRFPKTVMGTQRPDREETR